MTMKVFLIGYGRMAAKLALGVLQSGHELVGVFRADKLRHNFFEASIRDFFSNDDFYAIIKKYKIKEFNTNSVNNGRFISKIKKLETDVILVGSCGEKFGKDILAAPNIACVNVHPSLLPKYRGANPYFHTIKNGEKSSGVTFHLMNEKIDRGDILMQEVVPISDVDTGQTLRIRTTHQAAGMVGELLNNLDEHLIIPLPQNEALASYYPMIFYEDLVIDWEKPAKMIYDLVRASYPWSCCYTRYKDALLEIRRVGVVTYDGIVEKGGTVLNNDERGIVVATGDKNKAVLLTDVRFYGRFGNLFRERKLKKIGKNDRFE